jgi:hypothetical protein
MTHSMKALMVTAAVSGLLGGSATMFAAPAPSVNGTSAVSAGAVATTGAFFADKHACKGANACKGQGGCKSGDNGCKGKNSCKGKGGCATDGSKMPS